MKGIRSPLSPTRPLSRLSDSLKSATIVCLAESPSKHPIKAQINPLRRGCICKSFFDAPISPYLSTITMFSCTNYERGCRGRCNAINGRCKACVTLNLQRRPSPSTSSSNGTSSPSRTPPNDPGIASSGLQRAGADRSFMQLSQNTAKQHR